MMSKHVSAIGIARPSSWQRHTNAPVLTGEYAVEWRDPEHWRCVWSIICYVNGYPHKRILSLDRDALGKRIQEWLADPVRIDP